MPCKGCGTLRRWLHLPPIKGSEPMVKAKVLKPGDYRVPGKNRAYSLPAGTISLEEADFKYLSDLGVVADAAPPPAQEEAKTTRKRAASPPPAEEQAT